MEIYVVRPGDSVDRIAQEFSVPAESIIWNNQLVFPYPLAVGQALLVGEYDETADPRRIDAGGYAYTYISNWVLRQTMPFLNRLLIFSYGFTLEGALVYPPRDESWMIALCQENGTMPVLTLTPFGSDGRFNNNLIHQLVTSDAVSDELLENLVSVMQEKGYGGIDIDFEYILAEDRDAFTAFVEKTVRRMHESGFVVSVALAPKTSADQKGLLYEGKDYGALGNAADEVLLMTYEWGYKCTHTGYRLKSKLAYNLLYTSPRLSIFSIEIILIVSSIKYKILMLPTRIRYMSKPFNFFISVPCGSWFIVVSNLS